MKQKLHSLLWEIYQAEGQERLPGKAKLPGTCLFVDDKNHRERGRVGTHLARSRWMDWEMCYSIYWMLLNLLPSLDPQNFWQSVTIMPWYRHPLYQPCCYTLYPKQSKTGIKVLLTPMPTLRYRGVNMPGTHYIIPLREAYSICPPLLIGNVT